MLVCPHTVLCTASPSLSIIHRLGLQYLGMFGAPWLLSFAILMLLTTAQMSLSVTS